MIGSVLARALMKEAAVLCRQMQKEEELVKQEERGDFF